MQPNLDDNSPTPLPFMANMFNTSCNQFMGHQDAIEDVTPVKYNPHNFELHQDESMRMLESMEHFKGQIANHNRFKINQMSSSKKRVCPKELAPDLFGSVGKSIIDDSAYLFKK
jgi:hypothetical protein